MIMASSGGLHGISWVGRAEAGLKAAGMIEPPSLAWDFPARLKEKLDLTDEQIEKIKRLDGSQAAERRELAKQWRAARYSFYKAVLVGASSTVAAQRARLEGLYAKKLDLEAARIRAMAKILSAEQVKRWPPGTDDELESGGVLRGWSVHVSGTQICTDPYVWDNAQEIECGQ
jgi:hypothetical protein